MEKKELKRKIKETFTYKSEDVHPGTRWKTYLLCIVLLTVLCALLVRFAYLQIIKGEEYQEKAYQQQNSWRTISADRGTITDRNGNVLAVSIAANIVTIDPYVIRNTDKNNPGYKEKVAGGLSSILDVEYDEILEMISAKKSRYKVVAEKVDISVGDEVEKWIKDKKIKGVYVDEDSVRYYPNGRLASHLIGITGKDDQGLLGGIESTFDKYLSGTPGRIITAVDVYGNELPYDEVTRLDPVNGYDVVMTIDATIQKMVEEELKNAIDTYGAQRGGTIVVMKPETAEILAMASYPDYDLNDPYAKPDSIQDDNWNGHTTQDVQTLYATVWRNKALVDTYEPGSTFKSITSAIGLEENLITATSPVSDAPYSLAGWTIHCWRKNGDHGSETFEEAVKNSCNPVFSKLAVEKIGIPCYYRYIKAFGFNDKTGIELEGEAGSIFHSNPTDIDLAVTAFGQRIQITPIQLATAYCAIANGGYLRTPLIVKEVVNSDGLVIKKYNENTVRQVISGSTSKTLLSILEQVVADGTGSNAYVAGYRVAGKTGTSETLTTDTDGRYIVSFCGIAPADNPELVILVVLDHPTVGSASGGRQAAPVAGNLFDKILTYMEVERRYTDLDDENMMVKSYVPKIVGMTVKDAADLLGKKGFSFTLADADGDYDTTIVTEQIPAPNTYINSNSKVIIYTKENPVKFTVTVPKLIGMTLQEANDLLSELGLNMKADNIGVVISQSIEPGTKVEKGSVITITLENNDTEAFG
ncbi:MAG: PASTA domain-containing protein [Clostridia bacterium]|nr:PASTA domain-containing protein [Clostridia bacterium]